MRTPEADIRSKCCPHYQHGTALLYGLLLVAVLRIPLVLEAGVIHVSPQGDNTSEIQWQQAFRGIQMALDTARPGAEIWVAEGTYPEILEMKPGVALYGGFQGKASIRTQRNWTLHPSIIRPPLRDRGWEVSTEPIVTFPWNSDEQTRLDGFTLRGGDYDLGSAIYFAGGSPVIAHNTLVENLSHGRPEGAAVFIDTSRTFADLSNGQLFHRIADRLLPQHFKFGVAAIPIHPTNRYSADLHHLLQMTANLCDAAQRPSTPRDDLPLVFQPRFASNASGIVISGFQELDHSRFDQLAWRDLSRSEDRTLRFRSPMT